MYSFILFILKMVVICTLIKEKNYYVLFDTVTAFAQEKYHLFQILASCVHAPTISHTMFLHFYDLLFFFKHLISLYFVTYTSTDLWKSKYKLL